MLITSYAKMRKIAEKNGWKVPLRGNVDEAAWLNYWRACIHYKLFPEDGRPVAPHRSGGGEVFAAPLPHKEGI